MSFAGGCKFFEPSKNLGADGTTIAVSSGSGSADFAIDRNQLTHWRSVGSDDSTQETLTLTLPVSTTFDRILLLDHNFKLFDIQYDSGGFTDFSNVIGLDTPASSPASAISETTFADTSAYYQFDSVTTTSVRIRCTETQVVDAQKFLNQVILTTEIGTLVGFPTIAPSVSRNVRVQQALSGRQSVQKSNEVLNYDFDFADYSLGTTYGPDLDLMFQLFDREDPFIVWPCGGNRGTDFFPSALRGFRLEDAPTCQVTNDLNPVYRDNIYIGQGNISVSMQEVISG